MQKSENKKKVSDQNKNNISLFLDILLEIILLNRQNLLIFV